MSVMFVMWPLRSKVNYGGLGFKQKWLEKSYVKEKSVVFTGSSN